MDNSNIVAQPPQFQQASRVLQVDFKYRKWTSIITDASEEQGEPLYLAKCHPLTMRLTFRAGAGAAKAAAKVAALSDSDSDHEVDLPEEDIIGDGKIHAIKIDCETHVRGQPVRLSAAKRFLTRYTYQSTAFSSPGNPNKPAIMTWRCDRKLKCFNFVLLDESDQPVARFNTNYLGVKRLATIELLGSTADNSLAMDEIVITAMTLFNCMIYRTSSFLSLFGATFARPGKDYKVTGVQAEAASNEYFSSDEELRSEERGELDASKEMYTDTKTVS